MLPLTKVCKDYDRYHSIFAVDFVGVYSILTLISVRNHPKSSKFRLCLKIGAPKPDVAYPQRVDDSAESASARQDHDSILSFLMAKLFLFMRLDKTIHILV